LSVSLCEVDATGVKHLTFQLLLGLKLNFVDPLVNFRKIVCDLGREFNLETVGEIFTGYS
jgi:hypothetical protein